jgi:hypothetical protein
MPRLDGCCFDMGAYEGGLLTGVDTQTPTAITLDARPNPFNPRTEFRFELERPGDVELQIVDVRGAVVRTLRRRDLAAGAHAIAWDGRDERRQEVPSGIYCARLNTEMGVSLRKVTLLR